MRGMGKDWAKGLTKETDARVARAAAAHRGMRYERRAPIARDRRRRRTKRSDPLEWNDVLAYAVGLIATDGCLSSSRRHIFFTSKDEQLIHAFLECLGRPRRYRTIRSRVGNTYYQVGFSDVELYRWLVLVGLHPRKSLTLGAIDVPDQHALALIRGLLDGDGTIQNFVHTPTVRTYPEYRYERLWVIFCSGSRAHLEWLRATLRRLLEIDAYLSQAREREGRAPFYTLKCGKRASMILLSKLYTDPEAPRLERKWKIWDDYARRNSVPTVGLEPTTLTS